MGPAGCIRVGQWPGTLPAFRPDGVAVAGGTRVPPLPCGPPQSTSQAVQQALVGVGVHLVGHLRVRSRRFVILSLRPEQVHALVLVGFDCSAPPPGPPPGGRARSRAGLPGELVVRPANIPDIRAVITRSGHILHEDAKHLCYVDCDIRMLSHQVSGPAECQANWIQFWRSKVRCARPNPLGGRLMRRYFPTDSVGRASNSVVADKGKLDSTDSGSWVRLLKAGQWELFLGMQISASQ
ncbi:hypothetical protein ACFFX0_05560 [Citricoccus parietis]|uniref:Uncharacterized protein n=1 Tax=Citricoccus parietis TaxID=592307 RepID=A0ABV5FVK1_9MICC